MLHRAPKTDRSWWRVLTKHSPLETGMSYHFSMLALRSTYKQYEKAKKDITLKDGLRRSVGAQNTTGEERRNSSRRNEEGEPKQK